MKFTYGWLKDYLDTSATAAELTKALTDIGLEVESVEDIGALLEPFIVAKIEEAEKHPDADKLRVCKVNDGNAIRQIVCGAPNARAGIYVVLATEGVCIPTNGMKIKQAKIRGIESNGMLCSADELGIGADSDGIIELKGEPKPGSSAAKALGMDDLVIDIAITPNRGDCFGVYGVARDLAAAGLGKLKEASIPQLEGGLKLSGASDISVTTSSSECSHYIGCKVSGVTNGPSPAWLKDRLSLIGQKPISALVDITNYLTVAFGRPAHVYDVSKLKGKTIDVRAAKTGESLLALDHKEYKLEEGMLVIADEAGPVSIAGIIGGEESGCDESTKDVFLEIALFDPISIARTGQKLALSTDARMRFERGVDIAFLEQGTNLALKMITGICGGEASELVVAGEKQVGDITINFNPKLVKELTSLDISAERSQEVLTSLGFEVKSNSEAWEVSVPSWRHDVTIAEDLVEEIARIVGYDEIAPISLPETSKGNVSKVNIVEGRLSLMRRKLASLGMVELHNWTFISEAQARDVGEVRPDLVLANPISSELSVMRSSLLPHLLGSAARNLNYGNKSVAIFEAGQVFDGIGYDKQYMAVAGLLAGKQTRISNSKEQFSASDEAYAFADAKEAAFNVLESCGMNVEQLSLTRDAGDVYHPGRSMRISLGGKITLGYAGELHPVLAEKYDIDGAVSYFEVLVENIPQPKQKTTAKKQLQISPYPSVDRDFAFTVDESVDVEQVRRAACKADKKLIKEAFVFDVYQGKHMAEGKKSVALRVVLESFEKTLNDEEIKQVSDHVIEQVKSATGAELRG